MAALSAIRAGLATQLSTISGLRGLAEVSGAPSPPCAIVVPGRGTFISYDETFEAGVADFTMEIVLLVSYANERASQGAMDAYLASTGPSSVRAAVAAGGTLGGVCDYAIVTQAAAYGLIEWGGTQYLGCRLTVVAGAQ
jgi:hypothetical protein